MLKLSLVCLLIIMVIVLLPGCGTSEEEMPVTTEFGRMLGYVPYSVFEEHDIWFGNLGLVNSIYGIENIGSIEEAIALSEEIKKQAGEDWLEEIRKKIGGGPSEAGLNSLIIARWPELYSLVGFDVMSVDRAVYGDVIPPRGFSVLEGDFDEAVIGQKLTEQGYAKTEYGQYSYYGIRGDFEVDLRHPLGRLVLASMNRVAVLDDFIILSPVTSDITGIFDTMAGDTPSVIDNTVCRALANSLGDALMATLTTPERIIFTDLAAEEEKPHMHDFTIPEDWGILHGYEIAALGYRADGEKRIFDIALYYDDKDAAEADGREIMNRMQTYRMGTYMGGMQKPDESWDFINWWQPEEPVVTEYGQGAVLKISCYPVSEIPRWASSFIGNSGMPFRDLLFLAPDPSIYIGKNEGPVVIYERE